MSWAPLVLLLVSTLASLVTAQQQSQSSSSIRTPYSCFYDECPAVSSTLAGKAQFESCLKAGTVCRERHHTTACCFPLCTLLGALAACIPTPHIRLTALHVCPYSVLAFAVS